MIVLALFSCVDGPSGPSVIHFGDLRIQPVLPAGADVGSLGLDLIHVRVQRNGTSVVDSLLEYDPTSQRTYDWLIRLEDEIDMVAVSTEIFADTGLMYVGGREIALSDPGPDPGPIEQVDMSYVGSGSEAVAISISPRDTVVTFGDSVLYRVTGVDADGNRVGDLRVSWSTADPDVNVRDDGWLVAPTLRRRFWVEAATPGGLMDSTQATVTPVVTEMVAYEGDGTVVSVVQTLPIAVQLLAADGLGVPGITVQFTAPDGASLEATTVITDGEGIARTMATLGSLAGPYPFIASTESLADVTVTPMAVAGQANGLRFAAEPGDVVRDRTIAPPVIVEVIDEHGNRVSDANDVVTLALDTNVPNATLGGTPMVEAISGAATFDDLTVDATGLDFTLVASAPGLGEAISASFTVREEVASIAVTPGSATLSAFGATQQLMATALDAAGNPIEGVTFEWTSNDLMHATVDELGVVTAVSNGVATITAAADGVSGSANVSVVQAVAEVMVAPSDAILTAIDEAKQLSASAFDANGHQVDGIEFAWSSDDESRVSVDPSGLVTATGSGAATVTATTGGVSGAATVTVTQEVREVTVTPGSATLKALDETVQFSAAAFDANGYEIPDVTFTWSSDDEAKVSILETGVATAIGDGSASITALADNVQGSADVTVAREVAVVIVTPEDATITAIDDTLRLTAAGLDANGHPIPGITFEWSSDNATRASVDASGLVTALGAGSTSVMAAVGNVSGRATVNVDQAVADVVVSPEETLLTALGAVVQLNAAAFDVNGHPVTDAVFVWTSDDDHVSVNEAGLATAMSNGAAIISATVAGIGGEALVIVSQEVATVTVTPTDVSMRLSCNAPPPDPTLQNSANKYCETVQLSAEARDANGQLMTDVVFTWMSSDAAVIAVDGAGLVTAVSRGDAVVTASVSSASASSAIAVH